jgi:hypothetical protein
LKGHYTGTFSYSNPYIRTRPSAVVLHLQGTSFSGNSDHARYPAIGVGSWQADNNTIRFENKSMWTADFDWNLILKGEFNYRLNGNQLSIWKTVGNSMYTYELTRIR